MTRPLRVPCSYQGGKQRVANEIVSHLLQAAANEQTMFYDLCCGSGAISIELVNRGVDPRRIVMLDGSSWGAFWAAIGSGEFNTEVFNRLVAGIPSNKRDIKRYMEVLAAQPLDGNEAELYPLLQACSFGGKQIWRTVDGWKNAFFRDYWEPTPTSVRQSPANPMQPSATELSRRVQALIVGMRGITSHQADIFSILNKPLPNNSVVYVDPPYRNTTNYGFGFDVREFVAEYQKINSVPLFVSEGIPLVETAVKLAVLGPKGGISGSREGRHEEWLNQI